MSDLGYLGYQTARCAACERRVPAVDEPLIFWAVGRDGESIEPFCRACVEKHRLEVTRRVVPLPTRVTWRCSYCHKPLPVPPLPHRVRLVCTPDGLGEEPVCVDCYGERGFKRFRLKHVSAQEYDECYARYAAEWDELLAGPWSRWRDGREEATTSAETPDETRVWRVGVISDTHGRLDDGVTELFAGVDRIVHAGDVGDEHVLQRLALVAPVVAVLGNTDDGPLAGELSPEAGMRVGGTRVLVGHIREVLLQRHDPAREGVGVVVSGHTHRADAALEGGVLFLNPGTANRTRGLGRPPSAALLEVRRTEARVHFVHAAPDTSGT